MFKRLSLLFLFFILFAAQVFCQSSVWRVSKGGKTLLLGGSVHILRESDFPLPQEFNRAYEQSAVLVLETDIGRMQDSKFQSYVMANMYLPGGRTLQSLLAPKTFELLAAKCVEYGIPAAQITRLRPSMVVNLLSVLAIQRAGFSQEGVDFFYYNKAAREGKTLGFLETPESQMDALISMGEGYEDEYVLYSLNDLDNMDEIVEVVKEWRTGKSEASQEMVANMMQRWPVIYRTLLVDRNASWMPKIEAYHSSGQMTFIIVGLAHLYGPHGLFRQLEDAGYTIEQFK